MANYYEEIEKTRKQMVSALTYPTVIMIFSLAVVTFIAANGGKITWPQDKK